MGRLDFTGALLARFLPGAFLGRFFAAFLAGRVFFVGVCLVAMAPPESGTLSESPPRASAGNRD
ncbi:MAG: hypothetical protein WCE62_15815 [Polyangiales bacterium]